jgi:hypothetical protein
MGVAVRKGRWRSRSSDVKSAENMIDGFRYVRMFGLTVEVYYLDLGGCAGIRA